MDRKTMLAYVTGSVDDELLRGVGARKRVFVAALAIVTAEGA